MSTTGDENGNADGDFNEFAVGDFLTGIEAKSAVALNQSLDTLTEWDAVAHGNHINLKYTTGFIRTSSRSTFRRCRRKFAWQDVHRGNRAAVEHPSPLWFGTGWHFAMEDYHGYRRFEDPVDAFMAYSRASKLTPGYGVPEDRAELETLAVGMLEYYTKWLDHREPLETYWVDGVPQVEVNFQVPIPLDPELLRSFGYDKAVYIGTIDRVCIDEFGRLWLLDYKTAKAIKLDHLELDGQITAYCWGAQHYYGREVAGFIYQQHKKQVPHPPEWLKTRGRFSTSKTQVTTHAMYCEALQKLYGDTWVKDAPEDNIQYLNWLASQETQKMDALISRVYTERNAKQIENEGYKILMEAREMLDPNLPIYPNPTRDCAWDCSQFKTACLMMDSGADWRHEIVTSTIDRSEQDTKWRNKIKWPAEQPMPPLHLLPPGQRRLKRSRLQQSQPQQDFLSQI